MIKIIKCFFLKKSKSGESLCIKLRGNAKMNFAANFPHIEGDPLEKIPVASFPVSSIYFSFTSLIFIHTFLKESFLAAGDGTLGILSWDQISFCSAS